MVAINKVPTNNNFLSLLGYEFVLHRAPNVQFFVQEVTMPGLNLPSVDVPNPFVKLPYPGDHIDYEPLRVQFKMDENLAGYQELHNWIRGLGFPTKYEEYKELNDKDKDLLRGEGIFSDITIVLLTNLKNAKIAFNYKDCWPTSLGGLELDTQSEEVIYLDMTANFNYGYFDIEVLA